MHEIRRDPDYIAHAYVYNLAAKSFTTLTDPEAGHSANMGSFANGISDGVAIADRVAIPNGVPDSGYGRQHRHHNPESGRSRLLLRRRIAGDIADVHVAPQLAASDRRHLRGRISERLHGERV